MSSINGLGYLNNYCYNELSTSGNSSSASTTSSSAAALLTSAPLCTTSSSAAALSSSANPISSSSNTEALVVDAESLTEPTRRESSSIEDMSQILLSDYALNIGEYSHHTPKAVEQLIEIAKSTKNPRILTKLQSLVEKFNDNDSDCLNENDWDFCIGKNKLRPKIDQLLQILSDKEAEKRTRALAAATSSSACAALLSEENAPEISAKSLAHHELDANLLNSIKKGNEPKINLENVCDIFDIAEYLDSNDLKNKCIEFCKKLELSHKNIGKMIDVAAYLDMDELFKRCDLFCAGQAELFDFKPAVVDEIKNRASKFPNSLKAIHCLLKEIEKGIQEGNGPKINLENVCDIFDIAEYLDSNDLKNKCIEFFVTLELSVDNIEKMIDIATYLDMDEQFDRYDTFCAQQLRWNYNLMHKIVVSTSKKFPKSSEALKGWREKIREKFKNEKIKDLLINFQEGKDLEISLENVCDIFDIAKYLDSQDLKDKCMEFCKTLKRELTRTEMWIEWDKYPDCQTLKDLETKLGVKFIISRNNIEKVIDIAEYLDADELFKSCDLFCAELHEFKANLFRKIKSRVSKFPNSLKTLNYFFKKLEEGIQNGTSRLPSKASLMLLKEAGANIKKLHLPHADSLDFQTIAELFPNLESLTIGNEFSTGLNITPDIGSHLEKLTSLKHLDLRWSSCSDNIGPHLAKLTSLEHLDLSYSRSENKIVPYLAKLTSLKHLNLGYCRIESSVIGPCLEKLTSLEYLDLSGYQSTDDIGPHLEKLSSLRHLNLKGSYCTKRIGPHLEKLTSLQYLNLNDCKCKDDIGPHLEKLTSLEHLILGNCDVTNTIGSHLEKLTSLKSLDLSHNELLTYDIGIHLEKLISLEHLNLSHNERLTDLFGIHLEKLTSLQYLNLNSNKKLTNTIGLHLQKLKSLKHLYLSHNNFTDEIGIFLQELTSLEHLEIGYSKLTDGFGQYLEKLKSLKHLDFSGSNITDAIGPHLAKLTSLKHLNLISCDITDTIGPHLAKLTSLEHLEIMCDRVTASICSDLKKLVSLTKLRLPQSMGAEDSYVRRHVERLRNGLLPGREDS